MNLLNKHKNILALGLVAVSVLLAPALPGQKRSKSKEVPEDVLKHRMISESEIVESTVKLQAWLDAKIPTDVKSLDMRNIDFQFEFKIKDSEGVTVKKKVDAKLTHQSFRTYAAGFTVLSTEPLIFDVMEVSAIKKEWFDGINAVCNEISTNLRQMDRARIRWNPTVYAVEYAKFLKNRERCLELLSRRNDFTFGKRSDTMKKLKNANIDRREKAYQASKKAAAKDKIQKSKKQ